MKSFLLGALAFIVIAGIAGCETVKGVGRDITGASSTVEDALTKKK